jgi:thiol-disulfide isomerase/thioredoxin
MTNKKTLHIILCFVLLSFNMIKGYSQSSPNEQDIKLTDSELKLNNDTSIKLADLKGKVVVLDFWYRACMPCLQAIPELIKIQEDYKNEVVIIGINDIDDQEDVTDYLNYKKANYLSTYKTKESISQRLKINSFPTLIVYDREGKLAGIELGYQRGMRKLKKLIKSTL